MIELVNNTTWSAGLYPGWGRQREAQITLVIKAGFWFDDRGELTPMKHPPVIEESDRFHDEAGDSSLAAACDTVPFKESSELLLFGTAHPPKQDSTVMDVSVGLRRAEDDYWQKSLSVYGVRKWRRGVTGVSIGQAECLTPLPLRYEFSYGGTDPRSDTASYDKNPVGVGYSARARYHADLRVPQIELNGSPLMGLTGRPDPAGFGPIPGFWEPRSQLQPKLDEEQQAMGLCPFLEDVVPAFYNAAPIDQRFVQPFEGNETLLLKGLMEKQNEENSVLIHLPDIKPKARLHKNNDLQWLVLTCDTLVISADERELHLVWRAGIPQSLSEKIPAWITVEADQSPDKKALSS